MALVPSKTEFVLTPLNGVMDSQAAAEPPPASTTLSEACEALAVGASVAFATPGLSPWTGPVGHPLYGVQWMNRWHYDSTARRAVFISKDQFSVGGRRSLALYDENAHTWQWLTWGANVELGHIYESFAFDPNEWEVYTGYWSDTSVLQRWTYGDPLDSWLNPACDNTASISDSASSSPSVQGMICWHPNLFGTGDGGIVAASPTSGRLRAWQRSSGAPGRWDQIPNTVHALSGTYPQRGSACYVRAWDEVIWATQPAQGGKTFRVPAGTGGNVAAAIEIAQTPIPCGWTRDNNITPENVGFIVDDPTGQGGPYLFEKLNPTGDNRYWRLSASYTWDEIGEHPFPVAPLVSGATDLWALAPLYPYGVFWCIASAATSTGAHSFLWRPGDQA